MAQKKIKAQSEKLAAERGLRVADDYLHTVRDDLMRQVKEVEAMIDVIRDQAVLNDLAIMVPTPQRELAPTKEVFIKTFGMSVWEKMKRLSTPGKRFVWKEDV
jgi:predicted site-specific integrase-resolvase